MKPIYYLCALAAIAATASSCSKEAATPEMKTISVELGAPAEPTDTKTVLVNGSEVQWTKDDKNIVCITTDGSRYLLTSSEDKQAATKTFSGEIPSDKEPLFYYYDMNKTGNFGVSLKPGNVLREQLANSIDCWSADSFPTALNFAIAKVGDNTFRNIHGYLKWTNNGNAIKAVKFENLSPDEYFTGYFDVTYEGTDPEVNLYTAGVTNTPYVLSRIGNKSIPANKSYYAIVIPGTYHGVKISIYLAEGYDKNNPIPSVVIKSDATFTVERGKYIDFGVLPIQPL